jgi:hypothetical protein
MKQHESYVSYSLSHLIHQHQQWVQNTPPLKRLMESIKAGCFYGLVQYNQGQLHTLTHPQTHPLIRMFQTHLTRQPRSHS